MILSKWFSLPLKVWLAIVLGSVLVALLLPRHPEVPPEVAMFRNWGAARPAPTPGAEPPKRGGILLLSAGQPVVKATLAGVPWEIREAYYSHHDNQFGPMIDHVHKLSGRYFASEAMPLPF